MNWTHKTRKGCTRVWNSYRTLIPLLIICSYPGARFHFVPKRLALASLSFSILFFPRHSHYLSLHPEGVLVVFHLSKESDLHYYNNRVNCAAVLSRRPWLSPFYCLFYQRIYSSSFISLPWLFIQWTKSNSGERRWVISVILSFPLHE